jgi:hypothetical protein
MAPKPILLAAVILMVGSCGREVDTPGTYGVGEFYGSPGNAYTGQTSPTVEPDVEEDAEKDAGDVKEKDTPEKDVPGGVDVGDIGGTESYQKCMADPENSGLAGYCECEEDEPTDEDYPGWNPSVAPATSWCECKYKACDNSVGTEWPKKKTKCDCEGLEK